MRGSCETCTYSTDCGFKGVDCDYYEPLSMSDIVLAEYNDILRERQEDALSTAREQENI